LESAGCCQYFYRDNFIFSYLLKSKAMKKSTSILATTMVASALVLQGTASDAQGSYSADASSKEAIRPFRINVPEEKLADLKQRILATQFPEKEPVNDPSQGVQLATIRALAHYWGTQYDWRKIEAKLNALPQFITEIDGLDFHFIHVRSKHKNALPIIVTHGWPGSVIEQLKIVGPLTDPTTYGGKAEDAFDVVIPSMAGYGYSAKPTKTGWDAPRMARAWVVLMKRLGYKKFVAQGGDWGALVTEQMGVQAAPELLAIHTNMPSAVPAEIFGALASHTPPAGLSADEKYAFDRLDFFFTHGLSYAQQMANHPQTLYGIADSPVGLAAWMIDHDLKSYELIARVFDGKSEGLSKDDILDNITITWVTNTAISQARLYRENKIPFFAPMGVKIPIAISAFPDELYQAPRTWVESAYPKLIHYNKVEKGGHFAAWEQPKILVDELRVAFKSFR
jgi:pimeloyl-ACP methyl ester carboxylesterase